MLKVTANDGAVFMGRTVTEIIQRMREDSWLRYNVKLEYKRDVRERVEQMTGTRIRLDPEGFIDDLEDLGLVKVEHAD